MPSKEINVDLSEIFLDNASLAQSTAGESDATMLKERITNCQEDLDFIYKVNDNAVTLKLKMQIPPGFQPEKQELCFGFQMTTDSKRFATDPFTMMTPVVVNCGKPSIKGADDAVSQSTAQMSQRSAAVNQSMASQRSTAVRSSQQ